jgi:modification methylase
MSTTLTACRFEDYIPAELTQLDNPQTALPAIAKNSRLIEAIAESVRRVPTIHNIHLGDAREMKLLPESVHLVVTSPPLLIGR